MNLLIKRAKTLYKNKFEILDVRVIDGKIFEIGKNLIETFDEKIIDCNNTQYLLPGFIDSHTHFGLGSGNDATADNFYDGSKLAAKSGITTFIDFADQEIGKSLWDGAQKRITEASDSAIDFTLHQGFYYTPKNAREQLIKLKTNGINTLKIFTTYKKYGVYLDQNEYDSLFKLCKELEILICCHCESDEIIEKIEQKQKSNTKNYFLHSILRPPTAEAKAISTVLNYAKKYHLPFYIVHLSSKMGLDTVKKYRKEMIVIAETTNHYLTLDKLNLNKIDGYRYIMSPPLRSKEDNNYLIKELKKDFFDVVASDHCSYMDSQKNKKLDIREIPSGIPGSQELPLILSGILNNGDQDLKKISNLLSYNPAKIFGLFPKKGIIEVGSDADFVILKKQKTKFKEKDILSKSKISLYKNKDVEIIPLFTILRGNIICDNGHLNLVKGLGEFVKCKKSSTFNLKNPQESYSH